MIILRETDGGEPLRRNIFEVFPSCAISESHQIQQTYNYGSSLFFRILTLVNEPANEFDNRIADMECLSRYGASSPDVYLWYE